MGELKISGGYLNVLAPVDISYISPHILNLKSMLDKISYFCKQSKIHSELECNNIMEPIIVRYHDMIEEYDSLSHLVTHRSKRSAWFGGIGSALKQLFGTLTEDDAIRYDNALSTVQENEKKMASLIKQNILITTSTLIAQNSTLEKIKINEASLKTAVNKLSADLNNLTIASQEAIITSELNTAFNILDSALLTLSFRLEDIVNSILFCNQNVLHPSVITPSKLYQELAKNYRHFPNDLKLPLSLDLELINAIIHTSKLTCYYYRNKIMFMLQIPLVTPETYSLFNNIPLPTPHDVNRTNSYVTIIPSSKYVAMTKDKTRFCTLDNLDSCTVLVSQIYVCEVMNTYTPSAHPTCESEIITKVLSNLPEQCETKLLFGNIDIWKPLSNNRWIYVQSNPSKLFIDCFESELIVVNLLGTGVLNMPSNCTAYCKNTKLIPKSNILNITFHLEKSNFNIAKSTCCDLKSINNLKVKTDTINLENIDLENLKSYQHLSTSIIKQTDEIINQPHFTKYSAHYSILTLVLFSFTICFIAYKIFRCVRPSSSVMNIRKKLKLGKPKTDNISLKEIPVTKPSNLPVQEPQPSQLSPPRLREIV
ncbi:hypothetical protein ABMA28_002248 [Loxostege sticticalis]|uniref:Envelope fusion protein n=1 Tax=Loxostege sticticalis TaxID=481309 RepID=A0ABD0S2H2_LOXSC